MYICWIYNVNEHYYFGRVREHKNLLVFPVFVKIRRNWWMIYVKSKQISTHISITCRWLNICLPNPVSNRSISAKLAL